MRKIIVSLVLSLFVSCNFQSALAFESGPLSIPMTPPAPKFSDAERRDELARRRSEVAAKMADKSMLILFSAEPKLYTNDVDYAYRQENNLFYLTNLKQDGATFVMTKDGANIKEFLFIPKPDPSNETWNGKMYTFAYATSISGVNKIIDSSDRETFLQSVKDKKIFTSNYVGSSNTYPHNI